MNTFEILIQNCQNRRVRKQKTKKDQFAYNKKCFFCENIKFCYPNENSRIIFFNHEETILFAYFPELNFCIPHKPENYQLVKSLNLY